MLSNIAISGAQVNFGIAVWKFIPRISLGLVRAWKRKDRQSIVTRKGWWEPLLSDEREKQHLFFSILLYLSHINMPVGPIYAYMYIIYYTHINLYVVCVYLYIYIHTYISAYVCMYIFLLIMWIVSWCFGFLVGDINRIWSYFWRSLLFAKVRLLILRPWLMAYIDRYGLILKGSALNAQELGRRLRIAVLEAFEVSHMLIYVA